MYNGSNCDRKPKLSDILTEPLNPRGEVPRFSHFDVYWIQTYKLTDKQSIYNLLF